MLRLIIIIFSLLLLYWVVKRAFFPVKEKSSLSKPRGEEMVQDPVCKCYIPRSQAYVIPAKGKKLFFCSEDCYRQYLASHSLPKKDKD